MKGNRTGCGAEILNRKWEGHAPWQGLRGLPVSQRLVLAYPLPFELGEASEEKRGH